jgi:transposase
MTRSATEQEVSIRVVSNRLRGACPRGSKPSGAIPRSSRQKPLELPCAGQVIHLERSVKTFFCREKECSQNIFAERLPAFLETSSCLTARLRTIIQAIVGAFTAQAGARFGVPWGLHLSRTTFLRSLQRLHLPPVEKVEPVGMDDVAWKRGKRSGTVMVAVESHGSIDLLPDRETARVKKWLEAHPESEGVRRDRGGASADGAAQGGPQAMHGADRRHLCTNLGDAVEAYLKRQLLSIPAPTLPASTSETKETPARGSTSAQRRQERLSPVVFERKQEMVEKVREMHR